MLEDSTRSMLNVDMIQFDQQTPRGSRWLLSALEIADGSGVIRTGPRTVPEAAAKSSRATSERATATATAAAAAAAAVAVVVGVVVAVAVGEVVLAALKEAVERTEL